MLSVHKPCCGYLDGLKCPYKAIQDIDGSGRCRIHVSNLSYKSPKKKKEKCHIVSWIERFTKGPCEICNIYCPLIKFDCEKHSYCANCFEEASQFEKCPICLSLQEC